MGGQFEREGFNKLYGWEFKNKISTKKKGYTGCPTKI